MVSATHSLTLSTFIVTHFMQGVKYRCGLFVQSVIFRSTLHTASGQKNRRSIKNRLPFARFVSGRIRLHPSRLSADIVWFERIQRCSEHSLLSIYSQFYQTSGRNTQKQGFYDICCLSPEVFHKIIEPDLSFHEEVLLCLRDLYDIGGLDLYIFDLRSIDDTHSQRILCILLDILI